MAVLRLLDQGGRAVAQRAVRARRVVVFAPLLDQDLRFPERVEDLRPQQLAATAAWCRKRQPTFADTLAAVRRQFWREQGFFTSHPAPHVGKLRPAPREGIIYALGYAA
jgi:hypothetical protein